MTVPCMPVLQLNGFLNMSWKKKVCLCDISGKKLFVFDQGEKKGYVFLLEGKK